MPRDINGNYTLPPGINPVVPGTVIEDAWANPTLADVANALTDSLSRTGAGGMLAAFKFADGNLGAPGIGWINEPTSGWMRESLGVFRYVIAGQKIFSITSAGIELLPGKTAVGLASSADLAAVAATADANAIAYAIALG